MTDFSITYRFLKFLGFRYSPKAYGNVTLFQVIKKIMVTYRNAFLLRCLMNSVILEPFNPRKLRPWILKKIGVKIGMNVFIGSYVYVDSSYAKLITIEDNVHIAARCMLLCHQRDLSEYYQGIKYSDLDYKASGIHIKKGALIAVNSVILPGVTIGEGSVIGASSLVTKSIPDWTIAIGNPAKVIKQIPEKEIYKNS
jgi:acetyltransferase-like isoleucine patch superfamily enzyme